MVSVDTVEGMEVDILADIKARIESELEVQSYLQDLHYALSHGATISFQAERLVDQNRDVRYTNQFTVADLFPTKRKEARIHEDMSVLHGRA